MEINFLSFIEKYKNLLGEIYGLEIDEIVNIEIDFNIKLPNAYKEYLSLFGKLSGNLLSSYLMTADKLMNNKDSAVFASVDELDGIEIPLKNSYFFFGQWQGYIFYFFDCEENEENPPVYILTDTPKIEKYKNSFTEFIMDEGIKPLLNFYNK